MGRTEGRMNDLIRRKDAIDSPVKMVSEGLEWIPVYHIKELPSAEPELKPISYMECANAMLKMWIDNVLTDGEYNRIMDKLNSKHMADMRGEQE